MRINNKIALIMANAMALHESPGLALMAEAVNRAPPYHPTGVKNGKRTTFKQNRRAQMKHGFKTKKGRI